MLTFSSSKKTVALFVRDLLLSSKSGSVSITITQADISVDFCALTVTGMSSEDTVEILERSYLEQLMSTS